MKNIIDVVSIELKIDKQLEFLDINISKPKDLVLIVKELIGESDRENFLVVSCNTKNKINNISVVSVGTLNSSLVHPREVFKTAILSNSSSIFIVHNHPSGNTNPSNADYKITEKLIDCGKILDINILDHIIIGHEHNYLSFREEGFI